MQVEGMLLIRRRLPRAVRIAGIFTVLLGCKGEDGGGGAPIEPRLPTRSWVSPYLRPYANCAEISEDLGEAEGFLRRFHTGSPEEGIDESDDDFNR